MFLYGGEEIISDDKLSSVQVMVWDIFKHTNFLCAQMIIFIKTLLHNQSHNTALR